VENGWRIHFGGSNFEIVLLYLNLFKVGRKRKRVSMGSSKSKSKKRMSEPKNPVGEDPSLPISPDPAPIQEAASEAESTTSQSPLTIPAPKDTKKKKVFEGIPAPTNPTKEATEHLSRELQKIISSHTIKKEGFSIEPVNDNIFKWNVCLFDFDENTQIKQDLDVYEESTERSGVMLEVVFPYHYPKGPPFIRVVYPRFHQYTGHITIGGSICVKDLTNAGWNSKNELTPFIIMIRNLLLEGGALIDMDNLTDYTETEAIEAFNRVAKQHGWMT